MNVVAKCRRYLTEKKIRQKLDGMCASVEYSDAFVKVKSKTGFSLTIQFSAGSATANFLDNGNVFFGAATPSMETLIVFIENIPAIDDAATPREILNNAERFRGKVELRDKSGLNIGIFIRPDNIKPFKGYLSVVGARYPYDCFSIGDCEGNNIDEVIENLLKCDFESKLSWTIKVYSGSLDFLIKAAASQAVVVPVEN